MHALDRLRLLAIGYHASGFGHESIVAEMHTKRPPGTRSDKRTSATGALVLDQVGSPPRRCWRAGKLPPANAGEIDLAGHAGTCRRGTMSAIIGLSAASP